MTMLFPNSISFGLANNNEREMLSQKHELCNEQETCSQKKTVQILAPKVLNMHCAQIIYSLYLFVQWG